MYVCFPPSINGNASMKSSMKIPGFNQGPSVLGAVHAYGETICLQQKAYKLNKLWVIEAKLLAMQQVRVRSKIQIS